MSWFSRFCALLCALHCIFMPVLAVLLPSIGYESSSENTLQMEILEYILMSVVVLMATKMAIKTTTVTRFLFITSAVLIFIGVVTSLHAVTLTASLIFLLGHWSVHHEYMKCPIEMECDHSRKPTCHVKHPQKTTISHQMEKHIEDE